MSDSEGFVCSKTDLVICFIWNCLDLAPGTPVGGFSMSFTCSRVGLKHISELCFKKVELLKKDRLFDIPVTPRDSIHFQEHVSKLFF